MCTTAAEQESWGPEQDAAAAAMLRGGAPLVCATVPTRAHGLAAAGIGVIASAAAVVLPRVPPASAVLAAAHACADELLEVRSPHSDAAVAQAAAGGVALLARTAEDNSCCPAAMVAAIHLQMGLCTLAHCRDADGTAAAWEGLVATLLGAQLCHPAVPMLRPLQKCFFVQMLHAARPTYLPWLSLQALCEGA